MMQKTDSEYLLCEKNGVYYTLMAVSGFYGAFTYLLRGGVFCNAQTGNVLLMGLAFGSGEWGRALYYLIPIFAYILGSFLSELLPTPVKHGLRIRWETLLMGIEICVVLFLGFLPESMPVQISQVAVNFIASMQYNTFREAQGTPVATTFATNHIRQISVCLSDELKSIGKNDKSHRIKLKKHFFMLTSFFVGSSVGAVFCNLWDGKAILLTIIPLCNLFVLFLNDDLASGKENLERKPMGH